MVLPATVRAVTTSLRTPEADALVGVEDRRLPEHDLQAAHAAEDVLDLDLRAGSALAGARGRRTSPRLLSPYLERSSLAYSCRSGMMLESTSLSDWAQHQRGSSVWAGINDALRGPQQARTYLSGREASAGRRRGQRALLPRTSEIAPGQPGRRTPTRETTRAEAMAARRATGVRRRRCGWRRLSCARITCRSVSPCVGTLSNGDTHLKALTARPAREITRNEPGRARPPTTPMSRRCRQRPAQPRPARPEARAAAQPPR